MLALAFRIIGLVVASTHAIPFRLAEELFVRDLVARAPIIGKCSDAGEVLFMFDTSDGVDSAQFQKQLEFSAKASRFLSPDVKIKAAVYGGSVEAAGEFKIDEAQAGLIKITKKVGGPRNAKAALTYARNNLNAENKIVVLFANDKLADKKGAKDEADLAKAKSIKIYGAIPQDKYQVLKTELSGIISDNGHSFVETKDMTIAEGFQIDLNVKYGGC